MVADSERLLGINLKAQTKEGLSNSSRDDWRPQVNFFLSQAVKKDFTEVERFHLHSVVFVVGELMKRKILFREDIARNVEHLLKRVVSLSMRSGWYLIFSSRLCGKFFLF